jgi:hypothetical protein
MIEMTNTLLTSTVVAQAALANLYESTVMLPLVYRDYEPEFVAGRGATVNVRKPATFSATEWNGSTVTAQDATETAIPVVLNHHRDVTFNVTSRERTISIVDFNEQFLTPAMTAMMIAIDADILAARDDITNLVGDGVGAGAGLGMTTSWTSTDVIVDARTVLSNEKVPVDMMRHLVVPANITRPWLKSDLFRRVDASGSTLALQEASLGGRVYGFNPYESTNISDDIGIAFHQTAIAFASRPLALPQGAADATIVNYKGIGLRVIFDYNMNTKSDVCSIDLLYGVKTLDAHRACLIDASGS